MREVGALHGGGKQRPARRARSSPVTIRRFAPSVTSADETSAISSASLAAETTPTLRHLRYWASAERRCAIWHCADRSRRCRRSTEHSSPQIRRNRLCERFGADSAMTCARPDAWQKFRAARRRRRPSHRPRSMSRRVPRGAHGRRFWRRPRFFLHPAVRSAEGAGAFEDRAGCVRMRLSSAEASASVMSLRPAFFGGFRQARGRAHRARDGCARWSEVRRG